MAAEVIESFVAMNTGSLLELSTQQLTSCTPNPNSCGGTGGCNGGTQELAFDYVTKNGGLTIESSYPYKDSDPGCSIPTTSSPAVTISGFVTLPTNNYTALMNAVAFIGPISVSVAASSWFSYSSGIFQCPLNYLGSDINHAVQLVGYGEEHGIKYWYVESLLLIIISYLCHFSIG